MLKRESHDIFDTLNRRSERVTGEPLTDDYLDAAEVVAGSPMVLVEKLTTEQRKL
jgi:hypothetical protein